MNHSPTCGHCNNKPAMIHVAELVEREGKKAWELQHVCEACAREVGLPQTKLVDSLLQMAPITALVSKLEPSCPGCSLRFSEFRRNGRVGCEECYKAFRDVLTDVLEKAHAGKTKHVGRGPGAAGAAAGVQDDLEVLHRKLKVAVESEAYEEAARLRDRIRTLEKGSEG